MIASFTEFLKDTSLGTIRGAETKDCFAYLGVPFARAGRFEYGAMVDQWEGVFDATKFGPGCPQNRAVHIHDENPARRFYRKEFRENVHFEYDEDCLNLNIFTPKDAKNCPVIVFFHGGGFDSGLNRENEFDGTGFAKRGVVAVFANYRVGVLGYFTHEEIRRRTGRDGNFGLDDQLLSVRWVKSHIAAFGGDPDNITIMGQSAGAISVQFLSLMKENEGVFKRAVMMSGGGMFPKFALPKKAEDTHAYWLEFMRYAGCDSFEDFRKADVSRLFDAVEIIRTKRSDNVYHTMPVIDGVLLPSPIDEMIKTPLDVDYMLGYTNTDLYAPAMAYIANRFGKANHAYLYYFDIDAPGDDNKAFHACDLRYMFETLDRSWRPYTEHDHEVASELASYVANFAKTGDPNGPGLPVWKNTRPHSIAGAMCFSPEKTAMGHAHYAKLAVNFLRHPEPKA